MPANHHGQLVHSPAVVRRTTESTTPMIGNPITRLRPKRRRAASSGCQLTSLNGFTMAKDRASDGRSRFLVEFECRYVRLPFRFARRWLLFLVQDAILHHQHVHVRGAEAPVGVVRRANDRFTADIETGIYENTTSGATLDFAK